MNENDDHDRSGSDLRTIPGVGPSIEADLMSIGINDLDDLIGKRPEALYDALCRRKLDTVDRCVLYVFRCAVYFAEHRTCGHDPELLKWWNWKDKARPTSEGSEEDPSGKHGPVPPTKRWPLKSIKDPESSRKNPDERTIFEDDS